MLLDILKETLLQHLGPLKAAPKGWQRRNCPLCHTQGHGADKRGRFGIQFAPDHIAANCFNCGYHAGYRETEPMSKQFKLLLTTLNISPKFIKHLEFESFKLRNSIEQHKDGGTSDNYLDRMRGASTRWLPVSLPDDAYPITTWLELGLDTDDFMGVVNYALSRRILSLDDFYWTPNKRYNLNRRLIIPYRYNNTIVGYTARLSYDQKSKDVPKYFQQCPTDFVYNLDAQQAHARKHVIVTEGVLDAWAVDGVGVLGEITPAKVEIINRLHKNIIVCPDRDLKGGALVEAAIKNRWGVAFPRWDRDIKDAAQAAQRYGRLLTTHSIVQSSVRNTDKVRIMWEIMLNERK